MITIEYTIDKFSKLSNVSSRTLRYYDEIGLLKPKRVNSSGYRIYGKREVDLLQQILFYKSLDFELSEIKTIITNEDFDILNALNNHLFKLEEKKNQINTLINNVNTTIKSYKGELTMSDKEKFMGFKESKIKENEAKYGNEIREKYGNKRIDEENKKFMNLSKEEYNKIEGLSKQINDQLIVATSINDPKSNESKQLAYLHQEWIKCCWTKYSKEAHLGLVNMYLEDERFTKYYELIVKGGALVLKEAVEEYLKENN